MFGVMRQLKFSAAELLIVAMIRSPVVGRYCTCELDGLWRIENATAGTQAQVPS